MRKISRVERKMRRRRLYFRIFLLGLFVTLLIVLALNTDLFIINNIQVIGNNKLSKESIILGSSINIGENILKVRTKDGENNLRNLAYIKDVNIKRKLPKGIIIEIIERKEVFQIKNLSYVALIDEEGYILDILDSENENLPLISGFNIENKRIGENLIASEDTKLNFEFIEEGHALGLLSKMKDVDMTDNDNINIELNDGIMVAFGTINNVKYKLNLLNEILKDIDKKGLSCKMILMDRGDNPVIVLNEE
ncbi:MAG: FtsQ-type POTRA domain-containing protein [Tissierellia bacterium]|nr:FtsQ-type POTRA domain-containing protein [Tissierellia bacterium]